MTDIDSIHDGLGSVIERFDHVSIAVHDIDIAKALVELLGGTHIGGGLSHEGDFRWIQFDLPEQGRLEMISAVTELIGLP